MSRTAQAASRPRRSGSKAQELEAALESMLAIRAFEETVGKAHAEGLLPGLLHLSIGSEAVAVAVARALETRDRLYTSHRGHGHFLAMGVPADRLMAELAGRDTGICRGRGGSMHLMSERAVLATGIVGGSLPVALGHAMAVAGTGAVVAAFFGDGAVQTGTFHETVNLAALWKAPVLFVCENNGWAEFTSREEHTTVGDVVRYGDLYGIAHRRASGTDVADVRAAATALIRDLRKGKGPALLECTVTRLRPHFEGDLRGTAGAGADPIDATIEAARAAGVSEDRVQALRDEAFREARRALERALAEPVARPADDVAMVFRRAL